MSYAYCEGTTAARYDLSSTEILAYPDDALTVEDTSSPTGLRVDLLSQPFVEPLNDAMDPVVEAASTRSGFGRLTNVVLRFDGPVADPTVTAEDSMTTSGIQLLDLSTTPPTRVPYEVIVGLEADQLLISPLYPMQAGTEHALIVTTDFTDADGGCIAPAPGIRTRFEDPSDPLHDRQMAAVEAAGLTPEQTSHVLLFTTQLDQQVVTEAAEHLQSQSYSWMTPPTCVDNVCTGTFMATDYRTDDLQIDPDGVDQWELTVTIWLPETGTAPYPTMVVGHGLSADSGIGNSAYDRFKDLGYAVVATDALYHGNHPTRPEATVAALGVLGLDINNLQIIPAQLRASFDQSNLDRLQMIELLAQNPDIDGDNSPDLQTDDMLYYGVSLSGMMGSELLSHSDRFVAGVFAVGGGDLKKFINDNVFLQGFRPLLEQLLGPGDEFERQIAMWQTGIDAADPANWAPHVLNQRLDSSQAPDILLPVALTDDTVPPTAAKQLARALELPQLQPTLESVPLVEEVTGPISGNLASGATGAYFQLDRITSGDTVVEAQHSATEMSPEVVWMARQLFETSLAGDGVIEEPYAAMGTPPL